MRRRPDVELHFMVCKWLLSRSTVTPREVCEQWAVQREQAHRWLGAAERAGVLRRVDEGDGQRALYERA